MNLISNPIFSQIVNKKIVRYGTIHAQGISLPGTQTCLKQIRVCINEYCESRTLYLNKKPACRSFDAITAFYNCEKKCSGCEYIEQCTPQVSLDCTMANNPIRFMLSYTSGYNFLTFIQLCSLKNKKIKGREIIISVINRGNWGEAEFEFAD